MAATWRPAAAMADDMAGTDQASTLARPPLAYEVSAYELAPHLRAGGERCWTLEEVLPVLAVRVAAEKNRRELRVYYYRIGHTLAFPLPLSAAPQRKTAAAGDSEYELSVYDMALLGAGKPLANPARRLAPLGRCGGGQIAAARAGCPVGLGAFWSGGRKGGAGDRPSGRMSLPGAGRCVRLGTRTSPAGDGSGEGPAGARCATVVREDLERREAAHAAATAQSSDYRAGAQCPARASD